MLFYYRNTQNPYIIFEHINGNTARNAVLTCGLFEKKEFLYAA